MTSHCDSHTITYIKLEMIPGVQTGIGIPHENIICAHKQKRRHFHAKTTSAKLYIYMGLGLRCLYIDKAHIPFCGIFKKAFGRLSFPFHLEFIQI